MRLTVYVLTDAVGNGRVVRQADVGGFAVRIDRRALGIGGARQDALRVSASVEDTTRARTLPDARSLTLTTAALPTGPPPALGRLRAWLFFSLRTTNV